MVQVVEMFHQEKVEMYRMIDKESLIEMLIEANRHLSKRTPIVGCLSPIEKLESIMSKFGEAHNMLARTKLSKEEYQPISSLLETAKVDLFNYYYELKTGINEAQNQALQQDAVRTSTDY